MGGDPRPRQFTPTAPAVQHKQLWQEGGLQGQRVRRRRAQRRVRDGRAKISPQSSPRGNELRTSLEQEHRSTRGFPNAVKVLFLRSRGTGQAGHNTVPVHRLLPKGEFKQVEGTGGFPHSH